MTNVKQSSLTRAAMATVVLAVAAAAHAAGPWEVRLQKTVVDPTFRSEGVDVGDVNHDGKLDILVGDLWYEAPNWTPHEIRPVGKYVAARGYSKCFNCFALDVNGDGWVDEVTVVFPGKPGLWYENPKNKPGHWKEREFAPNVCNETPLQADLLGNGSKVVVCGSEGDMAWFAPNADENKPFDKHVIARGPNAPGTKRFSHGLGVGDINGDGRNDVLINSGWWEAPKDRTKEGWTFHKADLGPDCANMLVYDIDGDGDSDVISSSAHKYGIWWFEQKPGKSGEPTFVQHVIDDTWSQSHAAELADMNGDGLMDLVIGKRHLAHNGGDPDSKGPAVMYWYELRRPAKGKVEFVPHKFDDCSGVGTQFMVADMNGDGKPDVITSNKSGVQVFIQAEAAPSGKAVSLFDGKTFAGWEGDESFFRVEDGAVVGGSLKGKVAHNAFLCTTKEYGDFELRLKFRLLGKNANAGVQFRSKRIPNHFEVSGYQADMGQSYWGCLYDESRRRKVLARPGAATLAKAMKASKDGWNEYVIRCEGPHVQLWLNGVQTVDYTEADDKIGRTGVIGLQIHGGGPSEAWYKDIRITELK